MTEAVLAQGVKLGVKIDSVWTYFAEVKTTPSVGESVSKVDVTNLDSQTMEYIKGVPDISEEMAFTMNAMPVGASSSNYDLLSQLDKNGTYDWRINYPQLGIKVTFKAQFVYSLGGGAVGSPIESTLTLIPKSTPVRSPMLDTYTVSYDANGGTGTMTDASSPYDVGATVAVKVNTFVKASEQFTGWNTQANGSGASYDDTDTFKIYNNVILYAQWSE